MQKQEDIVNRLISSVTQARAIDRADLLKEAANEIKKLRKEIKRLNKTTVPKDGC
jgi:hypothetical protein